MVTLDSGLFLTARAAGLGWLICIVSQRPVRNAGGCR